MTDFDFKDGVDTKEEIQFTQEVDLMKNRRKMAYWCLYTTMLLAVLMLIALVFNPELLNNYTKIEGTISTLILGWFGIIALYFGASTLSEVFANKIK